MLTDLQDFDAIHDGFSGEALEDLIGSVPVEPLLGHIRQGAFLERSSLEGQRRVPNNLFGKENVQW